MSKQISSQRVVIIGAGVGGLATAASLARAGVDVTVLEAHIYPGGCAGTFFHKGYRFDAGATLAGGFYPGGPMEMVARAAGIDSWSAHSAEPAMLVHLPGQLPVTRYGDERRWDEYARAFGVKSLDFWKWQENTADALWDLALRLPPWPAQSPQQYLDLASKGLSWLAADWRKHARPDLLMDAFSPVARHLKGHSHALRLFTDAQLLISAQTTSQFTNALYGASALDLPRRGVVHLEGGMEAVANQLVDAIRNHGGRVIFRKEATRIVTQQGKILGVETKRGEFFPAQAVVANLPLSNIYTLLGRSDPEIGPPQPSRGWGAYMVYLGLDEHTIPSDFPLHHQIVRAEPLGEANSVFLSISPGWDRSRAPEGKRAITLSTHTDLRPWWDSFNNNPARYEELKTAYQEKMLAVAEIALPGIRNAANLVMPGTPVTFERFTRRKWGWVGGYPQSSLFQAQKPKLAPGLWMVGDIIFPGQSMPAVALGGLRVAGLVLNDSLVGRKALFHFRKNAQAHGSLPEN
jgi:C-3',4' desaturase CrtD